MRLLTPPPPRNVRALKGLVMFRKRAGVWHAVKWPRPRGPKATRHQLRARQEFSFIAHRSKLVTPQEYEAAVNLAKGTPFLPRDLLERAMVGLLSVIVLEDGTVLSGVRDVAPDAQLVLDQISTTPGSILVRTATTWVGLDPGDLSQILKMAASGLPEWADEAGAAPVASVFGRLGDVVAAAHDYAAALVDFDPTHSGLSATDVQAALDALYDAIVVLAGTIPPDLQTALDALSTDPAAVLYRDGSAWLALAPGTAAQVLAINGAADGVEWIDQSGGGGGIPYPPFAPPAAADFGTTLNALALTDVTDYGLQFWGAGNGSNKFRAALKALPAADRTYVMRYVATDVDHDTATGFVIRDPSTGHMFQIGAVQGASFQRGILWSAWSNDTTYTATIASMQDVAGDFWLKVVWHHASSTFDAYFSMDGLNWITLATAQAFVGAATLIGIGMWTSTAGGFGGGAGGLVTYWNEV